MFAKVIFFAEVGWNVVNLGKIWRFFKYYTSLFISFHTSLVISFHELTEKAEPYIKKKDTVKRKAVSVDGGSSLTLRFLSAGHSFFN